MNYCSLKNRWQRVNVFGGAWRDNDLNWFFHSQAFVRIELQTNILFDCNSWRCRGYDSAKDSLLFIKSVRPCFSGCATLSAKKCPRFDLKHRKPASSQAGGLLAIGHSDRAGAHSKDKSVRSFAVTRVFSIKEWSGFLQRLVDRQYSVESWPIRVGRVKISGCLHRNRNYVLLVQLKIVLLKIVHFSFIYSMKTPRWHLRSHFCPLSSRTR